MTDIELLELTAKAVGLNIKAHSVDVDDNFQALIVGKKGTREKIIWSPLADDGDALRLVCALCADVFVHQITVVVKIGELKVTQGINDGDKPKALRRAIVRAAAEIGAMQ